MKKIIWASIVCFILVGITFGGAAAEVFKNVTVGFELDKPASWHFITADQNLDNIKRTQMGDKEFQQMVQRYATAPLVAITKYPEPYDDLNPSFKVNIKPFGKFKGIDPKELLSMIATQFRNLFKDYTMAQAPTDVKVSGITSGYMRVNYVLQTQTGREFPTTSELWIVPRGDYFFMIGAGTRQDEATGSRKEVAGILSTVRIDH